MSTTKTESLAGESRNSSIPHPHRGAALAMWQTFAKAKGDIDPAALADKNGWTLALTKFHLREWLVFSGQATREPRKAPTAPAKKAAAKKAPAKKTAVKKAPAKKVA